MRHGADFILQDGLDGVVQGVQTWAPCWPVFLAYEEGDFLLNPGLCELGAMRGCRILLQGPWFALEVLIGPR